MLFLLKRTVDGSLAGLVALAALALVLRGLGGLGPPLLDEPMQLLFGVAAFGAVLISDGAIHGLLMLAFGETYLRRYRELAAVFRGQSAGAMLAGAAMAGVGEELLFRGLGTSPVYLLASAVAFGLLHHVRRSLWPFTLWAIWEGVLFGAALYLTGVLAVVMTAHFLHDLAGFAIFRHVNRRAEMQPKR